MQNAIQNVQAVSLRYRNHVMLVAAGSVGTLASAQTAGTDPAAAGGAAVTGLNISGMIAAFGAAIKQLVSENSVPLILVGLPVMAWYFIRSNLRGSV